MHELFLWQKWFITNRNDQKYIDNPKCTHVLHQFFLTKPEVSILKTDRDIANLKGHPHLAILPAILLATVLLTHPH